MLPPVLLIAGEDCADTIGGSLLRVTTLSVSSPTESLYRHEAKQERKEC